jgi:cysteine desulfuration protein SufE
MSVEFGQTSLAVREQVLVDRLLPLRDPQARFAWAVDHARLRPALPAALRQEQFRVQGCLVRLWLVSEFREGRCWFQTDSDAVTLRAFSGMLCDLASGALPEELIAWNPEFLERLGLLRQLADNRRATVGRVAELIRGFAAVHLPGNDTR